MTNTKNIIRGAGFTFRQLARELGLSEPGLNKKLKGRTSFTAVEIFKMAAIIGVAPEILLAAMEKDIKEKGEG